MIERLHIQNLAIVEDAQLEFGPGLNVLTGETGAGKSIVLGALGLLVGRRAAADTVRDGAREASVEAIFRTDLLPALEAELCARGFGGYAGSAGGDTDGSGSGLADEPADDGHHELVVRRTVARAGRSRARDRSGAKTRALRVEERLFNPARRPHLAKALAFGGETFARAAGRDQRQRNRAVGMVRIAARGTEALHATVDPDRLVAVNVGIERIDRKGHELPCRAGPAFGLRSRPADEIDRLGKADEPVHPGLSGSVVG